MTKSLLRRTLFVILLLVGVMGVAVMLPASAHVGGINHTWNKHYAPKVEAMLDDDFRWATVDSGGTLVRGRGATSSTRNALGTYTVTFDQSIAACSFTSTSLDTASGTSAVYTRIEVGATNGLSANQVRVGVINTSTATLVDFGFSLQVMC